MSSGLFGGYQEYQQMVELLNQRRWAEAVKKGQIFVNSPLVSSRDRAQGFYLMGICYNELGQYAEAEKMYEKAAQSDSDNPEISLALWYSRAYNQKELGRSLQADKKMAESLIHFQLAMNYALKARDIDPSDGDTHKLIAVIQQYIYRLWPF